MLKRERACHAARFYPNGVVEQRKVNDTEKLIGQLIRFIEEVIHALMPNRDA